MVVEPVPGSGGVLPPPQVYLERLRAICDRHGMLPRGNGVLIRSAGDALVLSPPLIIADAEIDRLFSTITSALRA